MRTRILYGAIVLLMAAVFTLGGIAFAQDATPTPGSNGEEDKPLRTISVTGSGQAFLTPDVAYISIGVHTEGPDASQAVADNSASGQEVVDAIRAAGIAARDIRTTNFSIYPNPKYDDRGQPTGVTTYIVNNTVYVTVRDINKVGSLLDAAVAAGSNSIQGVTFDVLDRSAALTGARQAAVANARAVAEELADAAGVELGEVQSISVSSGNYPSPIYYERAAAQDMAVPISPGEMTLSVDVSIVYAIR
jgi:uncharacterized protein YggE